MEVSKKALYKLIDQSNQSKQMIEASYNNVMSHQLDYSECLFLIYEIRSLMVYNLNSKNSEEISSNPYLDDFEVQMEDHQSFFQDWQELCRDHKSLTIAVSLSRCLHNIFAFWQKGFKFLSVQMQLPDHLLGVSQVGRGLIDVWMPF